MVRKIVIFSFVVLLLVAIGGLFLFYQLISPVCQTNCKTEAFVIEKGESVSSVANRLAVNSLIRNPFSFKLTVYFFQGKAGIQAGDYRLSSSMSVPEIARELQHGESDARITVLEGWRREEVADKLATGNLKNFDKKVFIEKTVSLEGKLFPDTYSIKKNTNTEDVISLLIKNFEKKVGNIKASDLILASLIEREVSHEADRPIVSGILYNRLALGWPLQIDATVQYAIASAKCNPPTGGQKVKCDNWWPKNLTKVDLKVKSPFNTYENSGLPPLPICNPSLSAIKAASQPQETPFMFYLSDSSGVIHYAKTVEEHNVNVRKYILSK